MVRNWIAMGCAASAMSLFWVDGTDARGRSSSLPPGIALIDSEAGVALASGNGAPLYILVFDAPEKRRAAIPLLRCGDSCMRHWTPVAPPPGLPAGADWSAVERNGRPVLAYKRRALYAFAGKDMKEVAEDRTAPPYTTSYSGVQVKTVDGVPVSSAYWQPALFQADAPDTPLPAGVHARPFSTGQRLFDAEGRALFVPRASAVCTTECATLELLPAPLAADAMAGWKPVETPVDGRAWSFRGKLVYYLSDGAGIPPDASWQRLESHD